MLVACNPDVGDAAAPAKGGDLRVIEHFEVGTDVYVRALAIDEPGRALWVGTSLGVHRVDLQTLEPSATFTRQNGLANEYVFAAFVDGEGSAWFGTNGGGLSRYRNGEWKTWFPMHGLADYWVYSLAQAASDTLWIGTWDGANRLDLATGAFETFRDELVNEWVYGLGVDRRGRIWFGTEGGVSMFDGAEWHEWRHRDGLGAPNQDNLPPSTNTGLGTRQRHDLSVTANGRPTYNPDYVFCIHVASDDSVWAGTWGGGAARFDGTRWHNYARVDGLAGDVVFAIAEDRAGGLWFGTDRGVSHFDGQVWTSLGPADGFPGRAVYALAVSPEGEVWAGTRGGVARIERRSTP